MRLTDEQLEQIRANESVDQQILNLFGFFGHYMFVYRGGLGGKRHVLKTLLAKGGKATQKELLGEIHISSASMCEVLGKLEREGLLERTRSAADKRQLEIDLTARGTELAREMQDEENDFCDQALDFMTPDEKRELLATLDNIFNHWREKDRTEKEDCSCSKN